MKALLNTLGHARSTVVPAVFVSMISALLTAVSHAAPPLWQAEWIWDRPPADEKNIYVYFRKEVSLQAIPAAAQAFVSADSRYQLMINGRFVGRGPVRSNYSLHYYDTYDLRPHLSTGVNIISAVVHYFGEGNERYMRGRGGFLFQANFESTDRTFQVKSDASWRVLRSSAWDPDAPHENDSNGFSEIFDARKEPTGWTMPGYDVSQWNSPFVIGAPPLWPWPRLIERDIPMMNEVNLAPVRVLRLAEVIRNTPDDPRLVAEQVHVEELDAVASVAFDNPQYLVDGSGQPTRITTPRDGRDAVIILDFGRVISGFPGITVRAQDGSILDVSVSEWLDERQQVPTVRTPVQFPGFEGRPMYTSDRVILRDGLQTWRRFFYTSFRYLQLTIRNATAPVELLNVDTRFTAYPFKTSGYFISSDARLNEIWNVGAYTALICTNDVFMDTPGREKGQWMDMVTPLVSHIAFAEEPIATRYLRTTALSQDRNGRMFFPYPSSIFFELPDQTMWWGMHLWQHYLYFGDRELLAELYPVLAKANAWFSQHLSARGLLDASWPDSGPTLMWPWIDHGHRVGQNAPGQKKGEMAALDALYYKFLLDSARVANALGRQTDAATYTEAAQRLKVSFNAAYWDPLTGVYWDNPEQTISGTQASILAVLYGLAPSEQARRILNNVIDDDYVAEDSGPHFYFFVLDALAKSDMHDVAIETIKTRWGAMLDAGASTWWEFWQLDAGFFGQAFPPGEAHNLSLSHGYAAAPTYFLTTTTLGVRPIAPGFSRILVAPRWRALKYVDGNVPSINGDIHVAWNNKADGLRLLVETPATTSAVVVVPRLVADEIYYNDRLIWQDNEPSLPTSLQVIDVNSERIVFSTRAGSHRFFSR